MCYGSGVGVKPKHRRDRQAEFQTTVFFVNGETGRILKVTVAKTGHKTETEVHRTKQDTGGHDNTNENRPPHRSTRQVKTVTQGHRETPGQGKTKQGSHSVTCV